MTWRGFSYITSGNHTITVKRNEVGTNRVSSQTVYHKNDLNLKSTHRATPFCWKIRTIRLHNLLTVILNWRFSVWYMLRYIDNDVCYIQTTPTTIVNVQDVSRSGKNYKKSKLYPLHHLFSPSLPHSRWVNLKILKYSQFKRMSVSTEKHKK